MPFEWLDVVLVGIMLISGLLALMRGFTREVLSLVAWGAAAVAGFFASQSPELVDFATQYVPPAPDKLPLIAVGAAVFLIVLILVSLISVKIGDMVLDSSAGPFDRTIGFLYGLVRGLLIVVIMYIGYSWLVASDKQEDWVREAKTLPVIESVASVIISFLPDNLADILDRQATSGESAANGDSNTNPADGADDQGYNSGETRVIDQLIEGVQSNQATGGQN